MNDSSRALWRVLGYLGDSPRKAGSGYTARCPAHEDRHASLTIGVGNDGRVLLNCHAGCTVDAVLAALKLGWEDLFEHSEHGNTVRRFRLMDQRGSVVAVHVREDLPGGVKDMHWERDGRKSLNGLPTENLPLYGLQTVLEADPTTPVIVCEGEKPAQALLDKGILAVGTVTGADGTPSSDVLSPLQGREVWLWPDNDDVGRAHMARIAERITPSPRWIDWKDAPSKGDAADWPGADLEEIRAMLKVPETMSPSVNGRAAITATIRIWQGDELAHASFDPVRWAIPNILPSGLTILAGRPKLGKSWLVLGWALDVARGTLVLRKIEVEPGDTLYLALEDSPRRMQERQAMVLGDAESPWTFHVATSWPRQNEGGLELVEEWISANQRARLVIIDTFKRFRPKESKLARLFDLDYDAVAPVAELATRCNVAIVIVFHTNKTDPSDPVDLISGTLGLAGAADGILVLKRERGQADASLFITGRDVEEQDLALKWDKEDPIGWVLLGQADQFRHSRERQEILDAVTAVPGMRASDIAAAIGRPGGNVRQLLFKMVNDAQIRWRDSTYWPFQNNANNDNSNYPALHSPVTHTITATDHTTITPVIGGGQNQGSGTAVNLTQQPFVTPVTTVTPDTSVTTVIAPVQNDDQGVVTHITAVTSVTDQPRAHARATFLGEPSTAISMEGEPRAHAHSREDTNTLRPGRDKERCMACGELYSEHTPEERMGGCKRR